LKVRDQWGDQDINARTVKLRVIETGHEGVDQSGLVQGELWVSFEHGYNPNFMTRFSRRTLLHGVSY